MKEWFIENYPGYAEMKYYEMIGGFIILGIVAIAWIVIKIKYRNKR